MPLDNTCKRLCIAAKPLTWTSVLSTPHLLPTHSFSYPTQRLLHYILYNNDRQCTSQLSINLTLGTSTCPWCLVPVPDIGLASRPQRHPLSINLTLGTSTCPWCLAPVPDIGLASRPQRHPLPTNDTRYHFVNEVRSQLAASSLDHHMLHVLFWPSWDLHDSGDFSWSGFTWRRDSYKKWPKVTTKLEKCTSSPVAYGRCFWQRRGGKRFYCIVMAWHCGKGRGANTVTELLAILNLQLRTIKVNKTQYRKNQNF